MIKIYYFTGSRNTLKAANKVKERFEKHELTCELIKMEDLFDGVLAEDLVDIDYIGLMFPVAIQSTFPLVWNFIEKLPQVDGQKIFMIDTMEVFSGGIVGPLRKVLEGKGYECIGALELKMTSSIQTKEKDKEKLSDKNLMAMRHTEKFIDKLILGKTRWHRIPILSDCMRRISVGRAIWRNHSQKLAIDHEICVECKICMRDCPVRALDFIEEKIIIDHNKCNSCMRCVHHCPVDAFSLDGKKVIRHNGSYF
jgi:NAD-dependent dihydropyrimidine dehydrogenase PreA subunit/flavodoxin